MRVDKFVALHAELKTKPNALPRQIANLKTWHSNYDKAILDEERAYLNQDEDLITIVPIVKTPLRRYMEKTKWFRTTHWFQRRPKSVSTSATEDRRIFYHSDDLIAAFDSGLVVLIGLLMLVAPIWVLYAVNATKDRLGVITVFVTAFLLLLQLLTMASPAEVLAAAAA